MDYPPKCACGNSLPFRHARYCTDHSAKASVLSKRRHREDLRAQRERALARGETEEVPYWLEYWFKVTGDKVKARESYNRYMRNYMRWYRARQRALQSSAQIDHASAKEGSLSA